MESQTVVLQTRLTQWCVAVVPVHPFWYASERAECMLSLVAGSHRWGFQKDVPVSRMPAVQGDLTSLAIAAAEEALNVTSVRVPAATIRSRSFATRSEEGPLVLMVRSLLLFVPFVAVTCNAPEMSSLGRTWARRLGISA